MSEKHRTLVLSAASVVDVALLPALDEASAKATQLAWEAAQLCNAVRLFWAEAGKPSHMMAAPITLFREALCCVSTLDEHPTAPVLYARHAPA